MWVVLLEDGIEFYKKKSDNSPKGMIPLKGSTLTSPCQDFGKRMCLVPVHERYRERNKRTESREGQEDF